MSEPVTIHSMVSLPLLEFASKHTMLPPKSVLPPKSALAAKETVLPKLPMLELAVVHEGPMVTVSVPVEGPVRQVMSPVHSGSGSGTPS